MDKNRTPGQPASNHAPDLSIMAGWMQEIRAAMGNMAVLYERDANRERRLVESEERHAQTLTEIKQQIVRVHQRLDQMNIAVREEVSSVREEFQRFGESHRQETTAQIDKAIEPVWQKVDENARAIKETKGELDGWINRARGGWFIGSICAGVFQGCIVAVLIWVFSEIKTMHDWRIMMEARREHEHEERQASQ